MDDPALAPALRAYFEGYNTSNREMLGSGFAPEAVLAVNHLPPAEGRDAVVGMHVKMGNYRYRVNRVITASPTLQVVEGNTFAVRDGEPVDEVPVYFAAVADLTGDGTIRYLRLYYDFGRMGVASKAAEPAS